MIFIVYSIPLKDKMNETIFDFQWKIPKSSCYKDKTIRKILLKDKNNVL